MSSGDVMVICPYHHIQSVLIEIKSTITAWVTWSQMDSPGLHSMFSSEQCNMGLQLSLAAVIVDRVCSQPDNMTELQWDMTSIVQYLFIWTWSRFAILFTRMANSCPLSRSYTYGYKRSCSCSVVNRMRWLQPITYYYRYTISRWTGYANSRFSISYLSRVASY